MQHKTYFSKLLLVVVMCITALSGCAWEKEYSLMVDVESFHFEPSEGLSAEKILASLQPVKEAKVALLHDPGASPINLRQQQFLDLASAIIPKDVQFESEVEKLFFGVSCSHVESGPQSLGVVFYRFGDYHGRRSRIETQIFVDAQARYLEMQTTAHYPDNQPFAAVVDLKSKLNAETILTLSDQNGGRKIRESMQNECIVQGVLTDNMWSVRYRPSSSQYQEQVLFLHAVTGNLCPSDGCR
jgi:hypothetical protein